MITKNFRLNALANQYAAALYNHITTTSNGDYFMMNAGGEMVRVDITGSIHGIRQLIDSYALEALKDNYPQWEAIGIALLSRCANGTELTEHGREIWQSMVNDMGASFTHSEGHFHA